MSKRDQETPVDSNSLSKGDNNDNNKPSPSPDDVVPTIVFVSKMIALDLSAAELEQVFGASTSQFNNAADGDKHMRARFRNLNLKYLHC